MLGPTFSVTDLKSKKALPDINLDVNLLIAPYWNQENSCSTLTGLT
jgi:hypothetical protein